MAKRIRKTLQFGSRVRFKGPLIAFRPNQSACILVLSPGESGRQT